MRILGPRCPPDDLFEHPEYNGTHVGFMKKEKTSRSWPTKLSLIVAAFLVGGITFYAAIVVPAASSVWGATDQGFVTRIVTWRFNAIAFPCWLLMLIVHWKSPDRFLRYLLSILLGIQLGLWFSHRSLDVLLDPTFHTIQEESSFYLRHQVYLWLTTAQILLGWFLIWKLGNSLKRDASRE